LTPRVDALVRGFLILVGLWVVSGTVLNLSRHPHWYVRGWDFPRPVIVAIAACAGVPYAAFFWRGAWYDHVFVGALALCVLWQVYNILPYTVLGRRQVQRAARATRESSLRLVISNVLIENRQHERWLAAVRRERPDVILALEVDDAWERALRVLERDYPHTIREPLANAYGMALFSRLPLREGRVEYVLEPGIPSVHVEVGLPGGTWVALHGVHPRPPEPRSEQDSAPRDAELQLLARRIAAAGDRPTVVAGDLNDVAWSYTTQLFLRESGLLDPRLGRGFYNTFNANSRVFRFPLDHVFHSAHFRLVELRRLGHVGSDHFPVLIELSYEPEARSEQRSAPPRPSHDEDAEEMIERAEPSPGRAAASSRR
jgi:endonuclease/exonuclease/phosphatase (EEP) superfamily protein YafD